LHLCKDNYAAGKRPGITEHCLRGRPVKPRKAGQQSTRFNSLNRSLGSIFWPYERQPGADPQGFIGLEDEVDQHWDRLVMGAVLSTVIGIGAELGSKQRQRHRVSAAARQQQQPQSDRSADHTTQPQHPADPHHPPGFPVRMIINRDLVLAAYQG
jgi:type IV secretory pathway VirB10-like protein